MKIILSAIEPGTAVAPDDYTAITATATIEGGDTSATIRIPIFDDSINERNETFKVTLLNAVPYQVQISSTMGSATVTIVDNDRP